MHFEKEKFSEQRLFERFMSRFPAKIKDSRQDFGEKVLLKNTSAQGAALRFIDRLLIHDSVSLEVDIPGNSLPVSFKGNVVWTKLREDRAWDVGIKFHKPYLMRISRLYELMTQS